MNVEQVLVVSWLTNEKEVSVALSQLKSKGPSVPKEIQTAFDKLSYGEVMVVVRRSSDILLGALHSNIA